MHILEKNIQRFTVVVFFIILLLPSVNKQLLLIPEIEGNENRALAAKPEFNINNLDAYFSEYDKYFTDNFCLRRNFIKCLTSFEFNLFHISPLSKEVIIGKDNWLFSYNDVINYRAKNLFSPKQIKDLETELLIRSKWVAQHNAKYYIVIVPTNPNIYPEFLPNYIKKRNKITRYDQIMLLDSIEGINIINIRDTIFANKSEDYYLYQKTDGHWNDLGAYYGYKAIMARLAKDIDSQLSAVPLKNYTIKRQDKKGALAKMLNIEDKFREEYLHLAEQFESNAIDGVKRPYPNPKGISEWEVQMIKINTKAKPYKLLAIRDSFGLFLLKYFKESFQETVLIHDKWKYMLNEDIFLNEKPDIYLNIIFENNADRLLKYPCNK